METEVSLHSLRFERDLGFADLIAVAAGTSRAQDWVFDCTPIMVFYNADLDLNLPGPLYIISGGESDGRSFEARLTSTHEGPVQWLLGGMWFQTEKFLYEAIGSPDAAAQFDASSLFGPGAGAVIAPGGEIFNTFQSDVEGEELALFGQLSWNFAPQWTVSGGGRLFRTEVSTTTTQFGFSTYPGAPIVNSETTEDEGFSPIVTLEYRPSESLMLYALVSEGYRFGQPNNVPPLIGFDTPAGSSSDSLVNYEIGLRSQPTDTLTFDATLFFVDWSDIQIRLQRPDFFNYATNGGGAESRGVEVALAWRPIVPLSIRSAITYLDAELTEPLVIPFAGIAPAGAPLPGSSDWTVATTLAYEFGGAFNPTATLSHRYVGEGVSDLNSIAIGSPNEQGGYNVFDARLRFDFNNVGLSLFANNIGDERGVTRTVGEVNGLSQGIIRPRTIGVTLNWAY